MAKEDTNKEEMEEKKRIQDKGGGDVGYIKEELKKLGELYSMQGKIDQKRKTYLEDLTAYKAEIGEIQATSELNRLIHIKEVRNTARKHSWYLKQRRQGMVDHIVTP